MIEQSASEISTRLSSKRISSWSGGLLTEIARAFTKRQADKEVVSSATTSGAAPLFPLGEPVHHGQFGAGRVAAHWPDGTLLIRFENDEKSRLVWPSLLNRVNGGPSTRRKG